MKIESPKFTKKELEYISIVLHHYIDIQKIIGKKQDKEWAPIMQKLANYGRALEGKDPL